MCVGPLLVFDFDHTIVDLNTDAEVQKLHPGGKIPDTSDVHGLYSEVGWTQYMAEVFKLLHENQVNKSEILSMMASLKYSPGMDVLLKTSVEKYNAKIIIISDSNSVFINHILEIRGIKNLVDVVFTNPAEWDGDLLQIKPYHHQTDCDLSEANLCKGRILDEYINSQPVKFPFVTYVGDGGNDFCPGLRLKENDLMCVRKGYSLEKKIPKMKEKRGLEIKSEILYWTSGEEILNRIGEKMK